MSDTTDYGQGEVTDAQSAGVQAEDTSAQAPEQAPQQSAGQDGQQSAAVQAAAAIAGAMARVQVTTGGGPGAQLPESKFPRLSIQRRILGHVTDEVDETEFGPRNTLASLTRALMTDRNSLNPPTSDHGKLDVTGKTVVEIAQTVLDHLEELIGAGLVKQRDDQSYEVTEAGHAELHDGQTPPQPPQQDEFGRSAREDGVWRSDEEQAAHEEQVAHDQQVAQAAAAADQSAQADEQAA